MDSSHAPTAEAARASSVPVTSDRSKRSTVLVPGAPSCADHTTKSPNGGPDRCPDDRGLPVTAPHAHRGEARAGPPGGSARRTSAGSVSSSQVPPSSSDADEDALGRTVRRLTGVAPQVGDEGRTVTGGEGPVRGQRGLLHLHVQVRGATRVRTTAPTSVLPIVMRARTDRHRTHSRQWHDVERVPDAPDRADDDVGSRCVELLADVADVLVDDRRVEVLGAPQTFPMHLGTGPGLR